MNVWFVYPPSTEEGRDLILCCGFSPSGRYFASCDDYKQLTVWQVTTATTGHGDVSPGNRNQPCLVAGSQRCYPAGGN